MRPTYNAFVFDQVRTIGRAWLAANPGDHDVEQLFEKIGEMSWRALVDEKPLRKILEEIGVNPDDYLPATPVGKAGQRGRLEPSGPIFRVNGAPWRWLACDGFALPMRHAAGEDITPVLAWAVRTGFVKIRAFFGLHWIAQQLGRPDFLATPDQTRAFLALLAEWELRCEWTTGDMQYLKPDQGDQQRWYADQAAVIKDFELTTAETVNEAFKNGVDPVAIGRFGAGIIQTSGVYTPPCEPRLDYLTNHGPRDDEWPRKGKELYDLYIGFDPDLPGGVRVPCVGNENMGVDETERPGSRTTNAQDVFDDAAVCSLLGAGGTYHCQALIYGQVPGPVQQRCADAYVAGSKAIPADAALGSYTRGGLADSPLEHDDALALRTFGRLNGNQAICVAVRPQLGWVARSRNGWRIVNQTGPNGRVVTLER